MRIWRLVASLVVVGVLASAAFASAAKLNLNSQGTQAGSALVPSCQTHTVHTSYGTGPFIYSIGFFLYSDPSQTVVNSATASNLDSACLGHTIKIVLTLNGSTVCPSDCSRDLGTKPITGSSVTFLIPFNQTPLAEWLTDVHVAIN